MEILKRPVFSLSILGLIFISLVIFCLPIYLTTLPSYCYSCHAMRPFYESWKDSTHGRQKCLECHSKPGIKSTTLSLLRTIQPAYFLRFTKPEKVQKPSNEACLRCHNEDRNISPSGILRIPHRFHIRKQKLKCIDCHRYLVHYPNLEGKNTPSMEECLKRCHDGKRATNKCLGCHPKSARPKTHSSPDWRGDHAEKFRKNPLECSKCHSYCNRCHGLRPSSHVAKWKFSLHGKKAEKLSSHVCATCHQKKFCRRCHLKHPPNWEQSHYVVVLKGNRKICYECHDPDLFCRKCHLSEKQFRVGIKESK